MRGSRRTIAAAVVFLFAAAVLEAHLHRAFARHGFCSEHGEPIHLDRAPTPAHAAPGPVLAKAPAPAHGSHDCAALCLLTQSAEEGCDLAGEVPSSRPSALRPPLSLPSRSLVLYELAPKGSPPA